MEKHKEKDFQLYTKSFNTQLAYDLWIEKNHLEIEEADYDMDNPKLDVLFRPQINGTGLFSDLIIKNAPSCIMENNMKTTVSFSQFHNEFKAYRPNNFSYDGLLALYDYITDYENDMGEEIELDVIALCCEYTEHKNIKEFQNNYGKEYQTIEDIEDKTTVIRIDNGGFIIADF